MLTYSALESNRFSLNVHRGLLEKIKLEEIQEYLYQHNPDLVIIRVGVNEINNCHLLGQISQYQLIFADALVYYNFNLVQMDDEIPLKNDLSFELMDNHNKHQIAMLVPIIFNNYSNHYAANPALDKKKILEGYLEWAQDYVNENRPDRISWLVKKNEIMIGFATCSFDSQTQVSEGILYGVHPDYAGGGVYTDIIKFTKNYFKSKGFSKLKVSTQLQNFAVQKVWNREGFLMESAFYTFHLNKIK